MLSGRGLGKHGGDKKNVFEPRAKPVKLSARLSGTWGSSPPRKIASSASLCLLLFLPKSKINVKLELTLVALMNASRRKSRQSMCGVKFKLCLLLFPEVRDQCKIGINFSSADVVACVEVANRFIKNDFAWRRICYTLGRMAKYAHQRAESFYQSRGFSEKRRGGVTPHNWNT